MSAFAFKLFDSHVHLVSPDTGKYPRVTVQPPPPPMRGAATAKIPVGERETPEINLVLSWMNEYGVEAIAAVQKKNTYGYDNSYILDSADLNRQKVLPVVVLNGEDVNTDDLVEYWVKDRNLAGVRFSGPVSGGGLPWLSSKQALKTWALADKFGLVMDLMPAETSGEFIDEVGKLAGEFPHARIVLDHIGWPEARGAPDYGIDGKLQSLAGHTNIYYKFTTINLERLWGNGISETDMLRHVVDIYKADHIMWGSDVGNSHGKYSQLIQVMVEATIGLNNAEKHQVMHDTGKLVFVGGGTRNL